MTKSTLTSLLLACALAWSADTARDSTTPKNGGQKPPERQRNIGDELDCHGKAVVVATALRELQESYVTVLDVGDLDKLIPETARDYESCKETHVSDALEKLPIDGYTSIIRNVPSGPQNAIGSVGLALGFLDGRLAVVGARFGSPAFQAGIRSGDLIVRMADDRALDLSIDDANARLKGDSGTVLHLTVSRPGAFENREFSLTRNRIQPSSPMFGKMLDGGIGYVRMESLADKSREGLEETLQGFVKIGLKGVVLDLRGNSGGRYSEALGVLSAFLMNKTVVLSAKGRQKDLRRDFSTFRDSCVEHDVGLAVLVDASTSSASEIVAGALQDLGRGVVVGDTTWGHLSSQTVFPLDRTYSLKATTADYYLPSGRPLGATTPRRTASSGGDKRPPHGRNGVAPDILVRDDDRPVPAEGSSALAREDRQLDAAIEVLRNRSRYTALLKKIRAPR